ncbi:MAG TPA: DUF4340 domain-containing protein [Acidobacteriota bacterium]|nr:DUF4340 domain-containing protein [Acidobacteriota bacterium]
MQIRNTLIMAVVLIFVGGFVYFYEVRGRAEREEAERQEELLVHFDSEQVTALELTTTSGTVRATKTEGEWAIVAPIAVAADGAAIDSLVDRMESGKHERLISEAADDLAAFGLAEPVVRATLELSDGERATLAIGNATPVGANVYVTAGESGAVHSALGGIKDALDQSLFDLRNKSALAFDEDAVRGIDLSRGAFRAALEAAPSGDDEELQWAATAPFTGAADGDTVDDLLSTLHTAEATAFVIDAVPTPEQLAEYGLADPAATVTLRTDDDASHGLVVGTAAPDDAGFYAMRNGGASVFVVESELLDDLPGTADRLRNKQVVALPRERVRTLAVQQPGSPPIHIERAGADWKITEPRQLDADSSVVSRLLSALEDLRAEGFASASSSAVGTETVVTVGLSANGDEGSPAAETIEIRTGGTRSIVPLSEAGNEEVEEVEATYVRTSLADTVYLVPTDDTSNLNVDLFELRVKTLVEFTQADLDEIHIETTSGSHALSKTGDDWSLADGGSIEASDVSDLLWDLNYLRMEGVTTEWSDAAPDLAPYGLASPRYQLQASIDGAVVADLRFGSESSSSEPDASSRAYAIIAGHNAVYEIAASLGDALDTLVEKLQDS